MAKKIRLVFIPSPGTGHLVSTVEFAKLLINRDHRLHITMLLLKTPHDDSHALTTSLASSPFSDRIHIISIITSDSSNSVTLTKNQTLLIKQAVTNLVRSSDPDSPKLAAFVVDMFCATMNDVAREFGVPTFVFFTSGVAFLGLVLHLYKLRERDNIDATELKGTDTELAMPSFVNPVPVKVFPSAALDKEWDSIFLSYAKGLSEVDGFIVNSFEELESHAIHSFSDSYGIPLYPVGPILNLKDDHNNSDNDESKEIMKWLDDQPPSSVIFLCFGSKGTFDEVQVREIARAVEASGTRFLWSLRKPPPISSMSKPSNYTLQDLVKVLPDGFLDRTAGIGRVIGWAPQAQVLAHRAIGGFVSHCGWNSILESVYFRVPIATWPLRAEQQTNAFQLVQELNMAVEIALDYRVGRNTLLSAEKIERGLRDLLEKNEEIKKKLKGVSEKSKKTLLEGGSSYSYLGHFIDYIVNQEQN
ncbi:hypothetical protein RIF29_08716 [Crotalaria pallida]|uniref:Glycosyltransferase n=1 Tax=Crotalaria pallida TaxID=3830 RepID=A0AAN9FYW7_CROPI